MAEIFVTAGSDRVSGAASAGSPAYVLIIFNVAFCMKAAQAKHNEALGMRVSSHKPPALQHGDCPTTQKCRDQLSCR